MVIDVFLHVFRFSYKVRSELPGAPAHGCFTVHVELSQISRHFNPPSITYECYWMQAFAIRFFARNWNLTT